jgi:hypothetical protein
MTTDRAFNSCPAGEGAKTLRGHAAQFFVAGELCRRGIVAVVTMGNCPNTDILCSNPAGTRFAHVQVKAFVPGNRTCTVGMKSERDYGENFFWILAGIPSHNEPFAYFIIPSGEMAKHMIASHEVWSKMPGKNGRPHDATTTIRALPLPPSQSFSGWSIEVYRNRWDLIANGIGLNLIN